jgi:hypothetical protein
MVLGAVIRVVWVFMGFHLDSPAMPFESALGVQKIDLWPFSFCLLKIRHFLFGRGAVAIAMRHDKIRCTPNRENSTPSPGFCIPLWSIEGECFGSLLTPKSVVGQFEFIKPMISSIVQG